MNTTSSAILQTVLATDGSLSVVERTAMQRLINGENEAASPAGSFADARLLVSQKEAAKLLSVSRVTIWRMAKDFVLHPVEVMPGTWRYSFREIMSLARTGTESREQRAKSAA